MSRVVSFRMEMMTPLLSETLGMPWKRRLRLSRETVWALRIALTQQEQVVISDLSAPVGSP